MCVRIPQYAPWRRPALYESISCRLRRLRTWLSIRSRMRMECRAQSDSGSACASSLAPPSWRVARAPHARLGRVCCHRAIGESEGSDTLDVETAALCGGLPDSVECEGDSRQKEGKGKAGDGDARTSHSGTRPLACPATPAG